MSNHPLGPWSQTVVDHTITVKGGDFLWSYPYGGGYSGRVVSAINLTERELRSGYNSGGPTDIPHPASLTLVEPIVQKGFSASGDSGSTYGKTAFSCSNYLRQPIFPPAPSLSSKLAKDKAFNKFINKQGPQFTALSFLGEFKSFKEDLAFVTNLITGRHNEAYKLLVKNLLKNKNRSKSDLLRVVSEHWLQLQFGLLPDLHDMESLLTGLQNTIKSAPPRKKLSATYKDDAQASSVRTEINQVVPMTVKYNSLTKRKTVGKVGATIKIEFQNQKQTLAHTFGVDIEDVLPALWEVTPWSWLVDYFTNAGDFINLAALRRGVWTNGWAVEIDDIFSSEISLPIACVYGTIKASKSGIISSRSFTFNRSTFDVDAYVPSVHFSSPNLKQAANIAAVAVTNLIKPGTVSQILSGNDRISQLVRRG